MEDQSPVKFGCITCRRTRRNEALDAAAEKVVQTIFEHAFALAQGEGRALGVEVPDELREKLLKWARKQSIVPQHPAARLQAQRNNLD